MGCREVGTVTPEALHDRLVVVAHHARPPLPAGPLVHPVQVDEVRGRGRAVAVPDAVPHPGADEGQVGVPVARLHRALLGGELGAQVHLVVLVGGLGGEDGPEGLEEERQPLAVVEQARGEALLEVAGGGVRGAVEGAAVPVQGVPELGLDQPADVDDVEAAAGGQGEPDLRGRWQPSSDTP